MDFPGPICTSARLQMYARGNIKIAIAPDQSSVVPALTVKGEPTKYL